MKEIENQGLIKEYKKDYVNQIEFFVKSAVLAALALWIGVIVFVFVLYSQLATNFIRTFLIIILPILTINIAIANSSKFYRYGIISSAFTNTISGLFIIYGGFFLIENYLLMIFGLILCVFFVFIYQRLPLKTCLICSLPYLLIFQIVIILTGQLDIVNKIVISFVIWSIEFFAIMASKFFEYSSREIFLKNRKIVEQREKIIIEKEKANNLLLNILPLPVAQRLIKGEIVADSCPCATILFADIEDFTRFSSKYSAEMVVNTLNKIFSVFDDLAEKHLVEKIKTIGDSYMAAAGIFEDDENHCYRCANMALDMIKSIKAIEHEFPEKIHLRIGINTGSVIAGVIGKKKHVYDLWSDAVNKAILLESLASCDKILVSESSYKLIKDKFNFSKVENEADLDENVLGNTYYLLSKNEE